MPAYFSPILLRTINHSSLLFCSNHTFAPLKSYYWLSSKYIQHSITSQHILHIPWLKSLSSLTRTAPTIGSLCPFIQYSTQQSEASQYPLIVPHSTPVKSQNLNMIQCHCTYFYLFFDLSYQILTSFNSCSFSPFISDPTHSS